MKLKRMIFTALVLIMTLSVFSFTVSADSKKSVYDRAGLFTDSEIAQLEAKANELFGDIDCDIYIVTDNSQNYIYYNGYEKVPYWGEHFIEEYGITGNSIVLIITANRNNNYNLYTYGEAYSKLSDSDVDTILDYDDVYYNIKSGDYFEGAMAFIEVAFDEYTLSFGELMTVALVIASIVTIILFICVYISYNKKMRSEKYPLNRYAKLDLKEQTDSFAGRFVTHRRIPRSTGSSSRGGGRSGGGGGGGHRGGR